MIQGYRVVLDNSIQRSVKAVIFVKIAQRPCDTALSALSELDGVLDVSSLSGDWDAILRVSVESTEILSKLNDEIANEEFVETSVSQIVLKIL